MLLDGVDLSDGARSARSEHPPQRAGAAATDYRYPRCRQHHPGPRSPLNAVLVRVMTVVDAALESVQPAMLAKEDHAGDRR